MANKESIERVCHIIKGGLEVAIYSFRSYQHNHEDNPDLCAIKLDIYNALNEG